MRYRSLNTSSLLSSGGEKKKEEKSIVQIYIFTRCSPRDKVRTARIRRKEYICTLKSGSNCAGGEVCCSRENQILDELGKYGFVVFMWLYAILVSLPIRSECEIAYFRG